MDRHKIIIILINFFLCFSINFLDKYKNSVVVIFPSPFLLKLHIYQTSFSQFLLHNCYFQFLLCNFFFNKNFSVTLSLCVDLYFFLFDASFKLHFFFLSFRCFDQVTFYLVIQVAFFFLVFYFLILCKALILLHVFFDKVYDSCFTFLRVWYGILL